MLVEIALMFCTVVLFKMKRERYVWVAIFLMIWLLICTMTAGWQKVFSHDPRVGFLVIADKYRSIIDSGIIPKELTVEKLQQLIFNNRLDVGLTALFMVIIVILGYFSIIAALKVLRSDKPTDKGTPYEPLPEEIVATMNLK